MFSMLGGNVDNFVSLGYFSGYNGSFGPYCIYLMAEPQKIMCNTCLLYTSPSPRDGLLSRMPSSA